MTFSNGQERLKNLMESKVSEFDAQFDRVKNGQGFIAALDQSGGSTPKALGLYGVEPDAWSDDAGMFTIVHEMRTRIMTSPAFTGDRVLGAILFEDTMNREVAGQPTAEYLWTVKNVIPFLKVDKGLVDEADGAQLMRPMPELSVLLSQANTKGVFGTKMRSVIKQANSAGVEAVVKQQFEIGKEIIAAGLVPIIEPEVDINCPDKQQAEELLQQAMLAELDALDSNQHVMLKLTLPEVANHYKPCIEHANVVRVVALSGGYPRDEANERLSRNSGMVASFSRALSEGLSAQQTDDEFNGALNESIEVIYQASIA